MQEKNENLEQSSNYNTAADIFIKRLQTGIITVNIVTNDAENYSLQKASESFDALLKKDEIKSLIIKN